MRHRNNYDEYAEYMEVSDAGWLPQAQKNPTENKLYTTNTESGTTERRDVPGDAADGVVLRSMRKYACIKSDIKWPDLTRKQKKSEK